MKKLKKLIILIALIFALSSSVFCYSVYAVPIVTDLQLAYNDVQTAINTQNNSPVSEPYYKEDSYQAFTDSIDGLGGLIGIQAVIDDTLALQNDVDNLTSNINSALLALILDSTYSSTLANFSQANSIDLTPYTSTSQLIYNNEMDRIEGILNTPTAGEIAIQALNTDIADASDMLVLRADITDLQLAYNDVQTAIDTQDTSPVSDLYYKEDSYQAFIANINGLLGGLIGIQAVIDDTLALQNDVDNLTSNINNALQALILDDTYNLTSSNFFLTKIIVLTSYTSDSQAIYKNEMDRIYDILNTPTAGEIVIQALNTDIADASDMLVSRGEKIDMNNLVSEIETIYGGLGEEYIPSTFISFKSNYDDIDTLLTADTGKTLQEIVDDIDATVSDVQAAETRLNETLNILVLKPDKSQLISDYNAALTINSTLYTATSYTSFTTGLELIEIVIEDLEAVDSEVTQAITDLSNLYTILVVRGDITDLQIAYSNAISQDLSIYTPNSATIYQTELNRINNIIQSDNIDQGIADQTLIDLSDAMDLLVLQADRSNLEILNDLLIKAYYEERKLYTASSHNAFKTACDIFGSYLSVNSVVVDDNATQASVDGLEATIQNALNLLVLLVDNSGLLTVYYELIDKNLSEYTTVSQTNYYNEIDRLYQIIIGDELDSDKAAEVLLDLSLINSLLVELPDYTELQLVYDSMNIYREEDYSVSSFSIFSSAKLYAEYMLTNLNATQIEIDTTIGRLNTSISTLKQTIEPIYIREDNFVDLMQYISLGQSTVLSFEVGDSSVISVDPSGIVVGLKYGTTYVTVTLSNGAKEIIEVNVIAGIKLPVYIMTYSIPVVTVGLASILTFGRKDSWIRIITKLKKIFKKKQ